MREDFDRFNRRRSRYVEQCECCCPTCDSEVCVCNPITGQPSRDERPDSEGGGVWRLLGWGALAAGLLVVLALVLISAAGRVW